MKIKVAPRPLQRPLPLKAETVSPVDYHSDETRRWYEAIERLTGVPAEQAYRIHYPWHGGIQPGQADRLRAAAVGSTEILDEMRKGRSRPAPLRLRAK